MERSIESESRSGRLRKKQVLFVTAVLGVVSCSVVVLSWRTTRIGGVHRSDPVSPYQNTRPGVKYLGDAACVRCHAEIAETYRRHPMGRSLAPIGKAPATDRDEGAGRPVFESRGLQYSIEHRDGRVFHQETRRDARGQIVTQNEAEVQFVLGSGRQGAAFLIERDGFLFESPLTWYSQKRRWDLSPGYEVANYHFDRPVRPGCLYCHANHVESVAGPINRYRPPIFEGHAIGCERCHGPGELHSQRSAVIDGKDTTIVNPALLEPALRDAVCEQCHLIGNQRVVRLDRREEDYRPGLSLDQFWTVLVQPADPAENRFVGQVEQMHESNCFRASRGRLGCISCHDPHELPAPEAKVAYYRGRCLECHGGQGCSLATNIRLERSRDDDCTSCHMPRTGSSDILHAASANHRIPRRGGGGDPSASRPASPGRAGRGLVPFHRELMDSRDRTGVGRDLGVALCRDGEDGARVALPLLKAALAARSDDVTAWEAKGIALGHLGQDDEALAAFRMALAKEPARESALVEAAYLTVKMDRRQDAATYWQRAIAVNPWRSDYRAELALVYFHDRNWRASADTCRQTLRLNPSWVEVRKWLVKCELQLGNIEAARSELATVLGFDPPDRAELLRSFSLQSRPGAGAR